MVTVLSQIGTSGPSITMPTHKPTVLPAGHLTLLGAQTIQAYSDSKISIENELQRKKKIKKIHKKSKA
jgi:hypothetical protein